MTKHSLNGWTRGSIPLRATKINKMVKNINTTIDKIALSEFDTHYEYLGKNEKQWCHDEMVNNPKWLAPKWK